MNSDVVICIDDACGAEACAAWMMTIDSVELLYDAVDVHSWSYSSLYWSACFCMTNSDGTPGASFNAVRILVGFASSDDSDDACSWVCIYGEYSIAYGADWPFCTADHAAFLSACTVDVDWACSGVYSGLGIAATYEGPANPNVGMSGVLTAEGCTLVGAAAGEGSDTGGGVLTTGMSLGGGIEATLAGCIRPTGVNVGTGTLSGDERTAEVGVHTMVGLCTISFDG